MRKIKIIFVCAAVLFLSVSAFADIVLTNIEKDGNVYEITFNSAIQISGVYMSGGSIMLPEYSKNGKIYKKITILQRNFAKNLYEDIKLNKTFQNSLQPAYKINKFKTISSHKTIKAFASVIFEEKIEVECRVMDGKYGLWIAWPSKKEGSLWKKEFVIINKKLKNSIENELLNRYTTAYERL